MAKKHKQKKPPETPQEDSEGFSPDKIEMACAEFLESLRPYWKHILVAVLLVTAAVLAGISNIQAQRQEKAQALQTLHNAMENSDLETLRNLQEENSGYVGTMAHVQVGRHLYKKEEYGKASEVFEACLERNSKPKDVLLIAQLGYAYALEAREMYEQAKKRFKKVADRATNSTRKAEAYAAAARCAERLNRGEEARELYTKVTDTVDSGYYHEQAKHALSAS